MDQIVETGTDQELADIIASIEADNLELPAFPDVVNRLQALLTNANISMKDVAALIQSDPVLTAKLLRTANSAAFNTRGVEIDNLNVALNRLGYTLIRSIAMAFAMRQAEQAPYLAPIKTEMRELLRRSNYVAAIACVVARSVPQVSADQAILAGLVHQIGTLYLLLTVQRDHPELAENLDYFEAVARLGATAAAPVLAAWEFPAEIRAAVAEQDGLLFPPDDPLSATGLLLAAAKLRDQMEHDSMLRDEHPDAYDRLAAVQFAGRSFLDIVAASQSEIRDIQESLSFNIAAGS